VERGHVARHQPISLLGFRASPNQEFTVHASVYGKVLPQVRPEASSSVSPSHWGAIIISKGWQCIMAALRILPVEAHPMDLRVGLPETWRRFGACFSADASNCHKEGSL
jgi:hypothetical protein